MSEHQSPETKRFIEAVEQQAAAAKKVRECLNNRTPGHELVVRLTEALREHNLAASETFKASEADIIARLREIQLRTDASDPPANT